MLTVEGARAAFDRYVRENPLPLLGTLFVEGWFEDADDFLPVWGAREYFVEGKAAYVRMDNLVVLIDKQSGAVRREEHFAVLEKTSNMTPVVTSPEPAAE